MDMKHYSQSNKHGCPTCLGVDTGSCTRCRGKSRLCDWWYTKTGVAHIFELTDAERDEAKLLLGSGT